MADRELRVRIIGDTSSLTRAFRNADRDAGRFRGSLNSTGRAAQALGRVAIPVVSAAAAGMATAVGLGTRELFQQQKASAQTAQALVTTGRAANVTQKQIEAFAQAQQNQTGIADDAIQSAENLLLTFTRVRNEAGKGKDIFTQASKATLDLSVRFGKDLNSSAILVGKALNDPIRGLTALRRVGVSFTDSQRDQIKALVASGQTVRAQQMILRELTVETGGAALAAGKTLPGQLNILKLRMLDVAESVAARLLPAFMSVVRWVTANWPQIERVFRSVSDAIGSAITAAMPLISSIAASFRTHFTRLVPIVRPILQQVALTIRDALKLIAVFWDRWGEDILRAVRRIFAAIAPVVRPLLQAIRGVIIAITALIEGDWSKFWTGLRMIAVNLLRAAANAIRGLAGLFLSAAKELGKSIVAGVVQGNAPLSGKVKAGIMTAANGIRGLASAVANRAEAIGRAIFTGVGAALRSLPGWIADKVVAAVRDAFTSIPGRVRDFLGNLDPRSLIPGRASGGFVGGFGGGGFQGPDFGRAFGGVIPGVPSKRDNVIIAARTGEAVLTPEQVQYIGPELVAAAYKATGGDTRGMRFASGGAVVARDVAQAAALLRSRGIEVGGYTTSYQPDAGAAAGYGDRYTRQITFTRYGLPEAAERGPSGLAVHELLHLGYRGPVGGMQYRGDVRQQIDPTEESIVETIASAITGKFGSPERYRDIVLKRIRTAASVLGIRPRLRRYEDGSHTYIYSKPQQRRIIGFLVGRYSGLSIADAKQVRMGGRFAAGGMVYPLGTRGRIIGTPNTGTHTLGNWQSDNAVDISIPMGTPVVAVESGRVTKLRSGPASGRFAGTQVTLNNRVFYTHLSSARVRAGQSVTAGQVIGLSGAANNVAHLHFSVASGSPMQYVGRSASVAALNILGGVANVQRVLGLSPAQVRGARAIIDVYRRYGLDPAAGIAVALRESNLNPRATGDSGTSFGLFQLHRGGALGNLTPGQAYDPETNAGVAARALVALGQRGRSGAGVVEVQTRRFERPADPDSAVRADTAAYGRAQRIVQSITAGGIADGGVATPTVDTGSILGGRVVEGIAGAVRGVASQLPRLGGLMGLSGTGVNPLEAPTGLTATANLAIAQAGNRAGGAYLKTTGGKGQPPVDADELRERRDDAMREETGRQYRAELTRTKARRQKVVSAIARTQKAIRKTAREMPRPNARNADRRRAIANALARLRDKRAKLQDELAGLQAWEAEIIAQLQEVKAATAEDAREGTELGADIGTTEGGEAGVAGSIAAAGDTGVAIGAGLFTGPEFVAEDVQFSARMGLAALTPGAEDDIAALADLRSVQERRLAEAIRVGDNEAIAKISGELKSSGDTLETLRKGQPLFSGPEFAAEDARIAARQGLAGLTFGVEDDIAALEEWGGIQERRLTEAVRLGDNEAIAKWSSDLKSTRDSLESLKASVDKNTESLDRNFGGLVTYAFRGERGVLTRVNPTSDRLDILGVGL